MVQLTFHPTFKNVFVILFNDSIAGKLVFNNNKEIVVLDIQGLFYHTVSFWY